MADLVHEGLRVATAPDVYVPGPNSLLLAERAAALARPGRTVAEIGCGAGLASLVAARAGARAVALDRNPRAVALARRNAAANGLVVHGVVADLLGPLRPGALDVILANLGWVPSAAEPDPGDAHALATRGGPRGMAVVLRLAEALVAARPRLPPGFAAAVVFSTLQDVAGLRARFERGGFAAALDPAGLEEGLVVMGLEKE